LAIFLPLVFAIKSDPICDDAHCSKCSESSVCESCLEDFILFGISCIHKNDMHCSTVKNERCVQCIDNYNMVNGNCERKMDNCTLYKYSDEDEEKNDEDEENKKEVTFECTKCLLNYAYNSTTNKCENCSEINPYCDVFDGSCYKCKSCRRATNTNPEGLCESKIKYCLSYSGDGVCNECYPGYYPVDRMCRKGVVEKCYAYSQHEQFLSNPITCKDCLEGYIRNPETNVCHKKDFINHCVNYLSDDRYGTFGRCANCSEGFGLTDDMKSCVECVSEGCEICEYASMCRKCKVGYYLDGYECKVCKSTKCEDNLNHCQECNSECLLQHYNETEAFCAFNTHCEQFNNERKCIKCERGYNVTSDGKCEMIDEMCLEFDAETMKCIECRPGYFIHSNFTCEKCHEGCITCSGYPDSCLEYNVSGRCTNPFCARCVSSPDKCELCDDVYNS